MLNVNKGQQDVLNPEGINAFRFFEGRGNRLWGARTMSSDPEWKYVNVRRSSSTSSTRSTKGTQWAVFEPNSERLWANVRRTIEDFLLSTGVPARCWATSPRRRTSSGATARR